MKSENLIGLIVIFIIGIFTYNSIKQIPFKQEDWKEGSYNKRKRMTNNLFEFSTLFIGKSEQEITKFLGIPDYFYENEDIISYKISGCSSHEDSCLSVTFSFKNNKVVDIDIY